MVNGDRDGQAYQAYQRAREAVLRMKQAGRVDGALDPSAYWRGELENIDYLIEASPLIVRKLRHHSFHVTGIRPYDYRSKGDGRREYFEARLKALRELGGDALLVPESPALGGFGYDVDGRLFNVDTLKFYEVLIAMERGGVLPAIRAAARPVVCEIGPGVGGVRLSVQDALSGRHLRARGLSRAVPLLGHVSRRAVPGRTAALRGVRGGPGGGRVAGRRLRVRARHAGAPVGRACRST